MSLQNVKNNNKCNGLTTLIFSGGLDSGEALKCMIDTMDRYMKGNFPSALLMIGGVGLAIHYKQLVNSLDGVPLILAWGKPVSGTTTAANAAMAIIGQRESIGGKNASIIIILYVSRNNVHIALVNVSCVLTFCFMGHCSGRGC